MKIFSLRDPLDDRFAAANPFLERGATEVCAACGRVLAVPVVPMIEWEPGSALVGDFTWTGLWDPIVTARVKSVFEQEGVTGISYGAVQMIQRPSAKRPARTNNRSKAQVWLPYEGPGLFSTAITTAVPIDESQSTAKKRSACDRCGLFGYTWSGVELIEHEKWVPGQAMARKRTARVPGQGAYVLHSKLGDAGCFRLGGPRLGIACTERVRDVILRAGLTNIDCFEMGEVIED